MRTFIHRQVAERALRRHLRPGEVVHHIDMDKRNNRPNNLLICTKQYHVWIHQQMSLAWAKEHLRAECQ